MEKKSRKEIAEMLPQYVIKVMSEETGLAPITIRQIKDPDHKVRKGTMNLIAKHMRVEWSGE